MFTLLLLACATPCEALYTEVCSVCDVDDYTKADCECIENREGKSGDYPDDYDISSEDAAVACDYLLAALNSTGDDAQASCKAQLTVLREHKGDACVYFGWEREDTGR